MVKTLRNEASLRTRETNFFDEHYQEQAFSPYGFRLRFERERESLFGVCRQNGHALGRVLSLGCGDGTFESMIAPLATEVVGVDLSPKAIRAAKKRAHDLNIENVDFRVAAVGELEFNRPFDTVIALAFLHHLPQDELAGYLKTMYGWLRPGGLFYSQDPNAGGVLRKVGRGLLRRRYYHYHSLDERELEPEALRQLVFQAGFEGVELKWIDLSLIPMSYVLKRGPDWVLKWCRGIDAIWCRSPLGPWCSGFSMSGWKKAANQRYRF